MSSINSFVEILKKNREEINKQGEKIQSDYFNRTNSPDFQWSALLTTSETAQSRRIQRLIQIHLYLSRRQSPMLLKMECGTEFRKPSSVSRELPMAIQRQSL